LIIISINYKTKATSCRAGNFASVKLATVMYAAAGLLLVCCFLLLFCVVKGKKKHFCKILDIKTIVSRCEIKQIIKIKFDDAKALVKPR